MDLNGDGRIGGPGITAKLERATHVDFNRDGVIGGHRPAPGGGKNRRLINSCSSQWIFFSLGLVGKIERATHIDINRDGYIGARPYYYPPPPPQCHKKKH